jgi:alkanesulfonate monooxygenase SsuD/methylene tetrahydromethanopterin reductase-like flavin-dependent oxidoreductase (luciferase family)
MPAIRSRDAHALSERSVQDDDLVGTSQRPGAPNPHHGCRYAQAMRFGLALDLHAPSSDASEVGWLNVRTQALEAERLGLDLVVLPDHLSYRAGDDNGYAAPDEPVGVREATTIAAAIAATTSKIGIGHSVINAPYRTPAMLAHIAATLSDVSAGRYSLGIGAGNSFDYDQIGTAKPISKGRTGPRTMRNWRSGPTTSAARRS